MGTGSHKNAFYGTLHYVTDYTGFSSDVTLQNGNYLAVDLSSNDFTGLTSVKIGLNPTYKNGEPVFDDSGLVELINDPDKNGVFKIWDNNIQKFKIVATDGVKTKTRVLDLSGLVCETE